MISMSEFMIERHLGTKIGDRRASELHDHTWWLDKYVNRGVAGDENHAV